MDSLKKGAWTYLDPLLLDLRQGEGRLDGMRWPRTKKGRPIFLHVTSLSFHHGQEVGASQHSLIWFQDLKAKSIGSPEGPGHFLKGVFRDLWQPELVAFVSHQVRRQVGHGGDVLDNDVLRGGWSDVNRTLVVTWKKSEHPFSWSSFEPIWRHR